MKLITTETLISKQLEIPEITGVYDPLTHKRDGTITSQAPIIVSGKHLDMLDLGNIRLCLIPDTDPDMIIEVLHVYKYTANQVIVSLPFLTPGEYSPVVKVIRTGQEEVMYIFPVKWIVKPDGFERGDYWCSRFEE